MWAGQVSGTWLLHCVQRSRQRTGPTQDVPWTNTQLGTEIEVATEVCGTKSGVPKGTSVGSGAPASTRPTSAPQADSSTSSTGHTAPDHRAQTIRQDSADCHQEGQRPPRGAADEDVTTALVHCPGGGQGSPGDAGGSTAASATPMAFIFDREQLGRVDGVDDFSQDAVDEVAAKLAT